MEVSVVIPVYNRRAFIVEAIKSVLAQTLPPREVIVVDDGSTDGTADLVRERFGTAVRIERLEQNSGISAARNRGWRVARGELIALLDSDDAWLPGKLAAQIPMFEDTKILAVHARATIIDDAGGPMPRRNSRYERAFRAAVARGYGYGGITFPWTTMLPSATVVRREVLQELNGCDEHLRDFEDWDLAWRIAARGKIAVNRDVLVRYRRHAGNTTMNLGQLELVTRKHLVDVLPGYRGPGARTVRANLFRNLAWVAGERGEGAVQRSMLLASLRAKPARMLRAWAPVRGAAPVDLLPERVAVAAWSVRDQRAGRAHRRASQGGPIVLVIDDGPSDATHTLLDALDAAGQQAVMFIRGDRAAGCEGVLVDAVRRGHALGNHSFSHPQFSTLDGARVRAEIASTEAVIDAIYRSAALSRPGRWFRFPYLDDSDDARAAVFVLKELGFSVPEAVFQRPAAVDGSRSRRRLDWPSTFICEDWAGHSEPVFRERLGRIRVGDVVEFHDEATSVERYLPILFDVLRTRRLVAGIPSG